MSEKEHKRTTPCAELWQWEPDQAKAWLGFPEPGEVPTHLDDFGKVLAHGWDTLEMAFAVSISDDLASKLDAAKAQAADMDTHVLVNLGNEEHGDEWQVSPRGASGGIRWWLANADAEVKIRPGNAWSVSIRHRSKALHELGADACYDSSVSWLCKVFGVPRDPETQELRPVDEWQRVTEAHWCVDVESNAYSKQATSDLVNAVVAHSRVKVTAEDPLSDDLVNAMSDTELAGLVRRLVAEERGKLSWWARGGKVETLTIGKGRPLTIQVYDKGREISEASGKTWMLDLWERSGWKRPTVCDEETGEVVEVTPKDVHRTEIRMRSEWMAERGVHTWQDLKAARDRLVAEALTTRRLTVPSETDSNRGRWPPHPLWQIVAWVSGHVEQLAPLGRRLVQQAQAKFKSLLQQAHGCARAAVVLAVGGWDEMTYSRLLTDPESPLYKVREEDRDHEAKVAGLVERYRHTPGNVELGFGDRKELPGAKWREDDKIGVGHGPDKPGIVRLGARASTLKQDAQAIRDAARKLLCEQGFGEHLPDYI